MSISLIKTVFCDIDGVIFSHFKSIDEIIDMDVRSSILPGVKEKFQEWTAKGYMVILVTGRPPSLRRVTEQQLETAGIVYYNLIMGLPRGQRVIINDLKSNCDEYTAIGINLKRDQGLSDVEI